MSSPRFSWGWPSSALSIILLLDTSISWTRRCRVEYFPLHWNGHDGHWSCPHSGGGGGEGVQDNGDEVVWTLPVSWWDCLVPPKVRGENQKGKKGINKLGLSCAKLSTAWAAFYTPLFLLGWLQLRNKFSWVGTGCGIVGGRDAKKIGSVVSRIPDKFLMVRQMAWKILAIKQLINDTIRQLRHLWTVS